MKNLMSGVIWPEQGQGFLSVCGPGWRQARAGRPAAFSGENSNSSRNLPDKMSKLRVFYFDDRQL